MHRLQKAFTTIELIVVILLLGVLSVTVAPKFITTDGFADVAYRDRLLSLLRLQQIRAMQHTTQSCHRVLITSERFGIPYDGSVPSCSVNSLPADFSTIPGAITTEHYGLSSNEIAPGVVSFSPLDIYFNPLGCAASVSGAQCGVTDITITITGETVQRVCIESQGYIHAGACQG